MADPNIVTLCITHNAKLHVNGLSAEEFAALKDAIQGAWAAGLVSVMSEAAGGACIHFQGQPFRCDTMPYLGDSRRMVLAAVSSLHTAGLELWAAARTTNKLSDLDTLVFRRVGMATAGRPGPVLALSIDACRGALVFVGDMHTADAVLAGVVPAVQAVQGVGRVVSCGRLQSAAAPDVYEIRLGTNPFNQPKAAGSVQSALVISEVLYALEQHGVSVYATVNLSQTDRAPDTFLLAASASTSSTSLAASSDKSAPPSYDDAMRGNDNAKGLTR